MDPIFCELPASPSVDTDMATFASDVRYAVRSMRRNPGFSAIAITALALGIGANTAIFSVVNGVILQPLPFREPDRLVRLGESFPNGGHNSSVSIPKYMAWCNSRSSAQHPRWAGFSTAPRTCPVGPLPVGERTVLAAVDLAANRPGHHSDLGDWLDVQGEAERRPVVGIELAGLEIGELGHDMRSCGRRS
jgi:hypothetical protein